MIGKSIGCETHAPKVRNTFELAYYNNNHSNNNNNKAKQLGSKVYFNVTYSFIIIIGSLIINKGLWAIDLDATMM